MEKPTKETLEYYDFLDAQKFIIEKYSYEEYKPPYDAFWDFILEQADISNGCHITMSGEWKINAPDTQKEIVERYLSEFGEPNGLGEIEANFYVWW